MEGLLMDAPDIILRVLLILATTSVFGIMFLSYFRLKNTKMLLISVGFGCFVLFALLGVPEILGSPIAIGENLHLFLHLIGLVLILLGILKD
jgi:hypothetical protein